MLFMFALSPAIHTIKFILTCPAVNNVLYAVMHLSVSEGPADICPSAEEANESSLAVIDTGQNLIGLNVNQRDAGTGVRHTAGNLHFIMTRQHMVFKRGHGRHKRRFWICVCFWKEIHYQFAMYKGLHTNFIVYNFF